MKSTLQILLLILTSLIPSISRAQITDDNCKNALLQLKELYEERRGKDVVQLAGKLLTTCNNDTNTVQYGYILYYMAEGNFFLKNYTNAISYHMRSIKIREKVSGKWNVDYSESLNDLGVCLDYIGKTDTAFFLYKESLLIKEKIIGKIDSNYAITLSNIANYNYDKENYSEGLVAGLEVIRIREKVLSKKSRDLALAFNFVGDCFYELEQNDSAIIYYQKAIELAGSSMDKRDEDYLTFLTNIGLAYTEKVEYSKATKYYEEVVTTFKTLNDSSETYAEALESLAKNYSSNGFYKKALPIFKECLYLTEKTLGKDQLEYAYRLENLAMCYSDLGKFKEALILFQKALIIVEVKFGKEDEDYATALLRLARCYSDLAEHKMALLYYKEVLEIRRKVYGENHRLYAFVLGDVAGSYETLGKYNEALPLYRKAAAITKEKLGDNHPEYGSSLSNIANCYENLGRYAEALPLYQEALIISEKTYGKEHPDYGISLSDIASCYENLGRYAEALPLYQEALIISEKTYGKEHPDYGSSLSDIANCYGNLGRYAEALPLYQEALIISEKTYGKEHPDYGSSLSDIASCYENLGRYAEALPLYQEALIISEKTYGKGHPNYARSLSLIAISYQNIQRYKEALSFFQQALIIYGKIYGEEHPNYATSLSNVAICYDNLKEFVKAEGYYRQSLSIKSRVYSADHPAYYNNLHNLAWNFLFQKRYREADSLFANSFSQKKRYIITNTTALTEKEKNMFVKTLNKSLEYGLRIREASRDTSLKTDWLYDALLFRKGILLESSKGLAQIESLTKDSALLNKYRIYQDIKDIIGKQELLPKAEQAKELARWITDADALERTLLSQTESIRNWRDKLNTDWKAVQKKLYENEASIEFITYNKFNPYWTDTILYAALIITKQCKNPYFISLFPDYKLNAVINSKALTDEAIVKKLYRGLHIKEKNIAGKNQSDTLYNIIWKPLLPHLKEVKKIYYCTDGTLNNLSIGAIITPDTNRLSREYTLIRLTSTRNLVHPASLPVATTISLWGGIDYTYSINGKKKRDQSFPTFGIRKSRSGNFNFLAGTMEEVTAIKKIQESKQGIHLKLFSGEIASEENFKKLSGDSPQILHIATHGFFFPDIKTKDNHITETNKYALAEDPLLRSGLAMTGANYAWQNGLNPYEKEDGILTAYEISRMDLSKTKLVVLSACETGLGDVKNGEGVYGLQRAFKMAGVDFILMSLWQIPDKETKEYMEIFYKFYFGGMDIRSAYRQTQKIMSDNYEPFKWAAFILLE